MALTLVFAFMPFLAKQLAGREMANKMFATKNQIETAHTAARIYVREAKNSLGEGVYKISNKSGSYRDFSVLESYGLPLGFNAKTVFGQDISLIIERKRKDNDGEEQSWQDDDYTTNAYLRIEKTDPNTNKKYLTPYQSAELMRMIGFFAKDFGNHIEVAVPAEVKYSDIVLKQESDDSLGFLVTLDMEHTDENGNSFKHNILNVDTLYANKGKFIETPETGVNASFKVLNINGDVDKSATKVNTISNLNIAYTKVSGNLNVAGNVTAKNLMLEHVGGYESSTGGLTVSIDTVSELQSLGQGIAEKDKTGGTLLGPLKRWIVDNNLDAGTLSFGTSSGRDFEVRLSNGSVFWSQDDYSTFASHNDTTSSNYGLKIGQLELADAGAALVMYNGTFGDMKNKETFGVLVKIAPAADTVLADIDINDFNNSEIKTLQNPFTENNATTDTCEAIINTYFQKSGNTVYDEKSLLQNIVCQYVFWERLERRINQRLLIESSCNN